MREGKDLEFVVLKKNTQEFLGYISLHKLKSETPEMGIWIKEGIHSQGYGFESLSLLKKWAEENLIFNYLKYAVDKNNLASMALAKKLGGKIEDEYLKKSESGKILDEFEYRFYRSELDR